MKHLLSLALLVLSLGLVITSAAHAVPIKVKVENLAPSSGNLLTPVWVGFHDGSFDLYDIGSAATPGLERLAEDGTPGPLSAEFAGSGSGSVDGTILGPGVPPVFPPGAMGMMTFDLDPLDPTHRYCSYASMVIPSNDAFIANGDPLAHQVFDGAGNFVGFDFIVFGTMVRDAGTEMNDEIPGNTAALDQMFPGTGVPEGGTVQVHGGFIPGGNILTAIPGGDFTQSGYQVARVRAEVVPEPSTFLLFAIGALAVVGLGYRQRRKPTAP